MDSSKCRNFQNLLIKNPLSRKPRKSNIPKYLIALILKNLYNDQLKKKKIPNSINMKLDLLLSNSLKRILLIEVSIR